MADLEKVAAALKSAATRISELELEREKYASDNETLTLQLIAKERAGRAVKLADAMCAIGLVKVADMDDEVDRLMEMDDKAFLAVRDAVEKMKTVDKTASSGLDTVSGLLGGFGLAEGGTGGRKTLGQALEEG